MPYKSGDVIHDMMAPSGLPALFPRDKDAENSLHILRETDGRAGEINVETEEVNRTDNTSCNEKLRKGHDSANSCLDDPHYCAGSHSPVELLVIGNEGLIPLTLSV